MFILHTTLSHVHTLQDSSCAHRHENYTRKDFSSRAALISKVGPHRSCAMFDELCGTNCSSSALLTVRPDRFSCCHEKLSGCIRWDDETWVWSNNRLWKLSTTYTVLTIRLTNVSICFKAVIYKPYRTFSLKFQAYTEFIVHVLLGSLGLTRGPGNNVIPEGLAIDEIPYIVNVPVASSDPQFDVCTLAWHHVSDDAVYPCDFTGWNEACQMTVFRCLAKRLCLIPSAFIVLRKNKLVDVIITLKNCGEKSSGECWKFRADSSRQRRRCPHCLNACRQAMSKRSKSFLRTTFLASRGGWRWEANVMLSMASLEYG